MVVKDVTPPSFNVSGSPGSPFTPSNPAPATSLAGAVVYYTNPTATDSNGGPVTVSCVSPTGLVSGSTFPIGTTDINCVATDISGISTPPTNLFDIVVADMAPPVITENASPNVLLWSPNKIMTPVTISGVITDLSPTTASYKVVDEYGKIQPAGAVTIGAGGAYSFIVMLEAYRNGNDSNGRATPCR